MRAQRFIAAAAAAVSPAVAHAQQRPVLGTVLDYAGGVERGNNFGGQGLTDS